MRFQIDFSSYQKPSGALIYRPEEYSFAIVPTPKGGFTSALLDNLNLELNERGKVISVWGMCPHTRWISATLTPPDAAFGDIFFLSDTPLSRGISIGLNSDGYLPVLVDPESGWLSIRTPSKPASTVRSLPGIIFETDEHGQLCGVWLKPERGLDEKTAPSK